MRPKHERPNCVFHGKVIRLRAPGWAEAVARAVWTTGLRKRTAKLLRAALTDADLRDALRAAAVADLVPQFVKLQSLRAA
jgi:hypothetical protein